MNQNFSIKYYEDLYQNALSEIGGIQFSRREIDVLSCIVNNRTDKKIAYILSISPRTVNTHVYNLMNKIGCNSRDSIIDFIEKNTVMAILREHYKFTRLKSEFRNVLLKISKKYFKNSLYVNYNPKIEDMEIQFFKSIKEDLKLANIILAPKTTDATSNFKIDLDSITDENYFFQIITYIKDLSNDTNFDDNIIKPFLDILHEINKISESTVIIKETPNASYNINLNILNKLYVILGSLIICFGFVYFFKSIKTNKQSEEIFTKTVIEELKKLDLAPNNLDKEKHQRNLSVIKQVESIIKPNSDEIKKLFANASLANSEIVDFLYYINALASYYTYNEHDGNKAREILLYAKSTAEHYANSRSTVKLDFEKLQPEEILSELYYFKDLPEVYTSIIYMIGRSYVYDKDLDQAEKYFNLTIKLASKLNMYEAYLSKRSGIALINKIRSEKLLEEGKIKEGTATLKNVSELYLELQKDNNQYIAGFKPNFNNNIITPSKDNSNILECADKIISCNTNIIKVSKDGNQTQDSINDILYQLTNAHGLGKLEYLIKTENNRKVASFYNTLGSLIFILYKKNIIEQSIIKNIQSILETKIDNNLELSKFAFNAAYYKSKNKDYTKKDAIEGLLIVLQDEYSNSNSLEKKQAISKEINDFQEKLKTISNKNN